MTAPFILRALTVASVWSALAFGLLFVAYQAALAADRVLAVVF